MIYIERKPALPLRRFVRCFWYANVPSVQHRRERILPSGCAQIVLSLSRTGPALVVGQRSTYEIIATADLVDLAGVLFEPGAFPAFLADRADLLSNRSITLDDIWCGQTDLLRCRMLEVSTPEARLQILEDELSTFLSTGLKRHHWTCHPAVEFALEQLARDSTGLSVAELAKTSGWSERRFSQLFREQVGFSPKAWLRLQRFQMAVRLSRAGLGVPWAELAIQCGFYDQAHLANEFRSFSGIDLTSYMATSHQLWANHARVD